jgi:hypothetical protein
MTALNASRDKGPIGAFYARLVAKGKPVFVALVAVMRRVLRAAWVIAARREPWNPALFAPKATKTLNVATGCEAATG